MYLWPCYEGRGDCMVEKVDMSVDVCGLHFKNPVNTASGTFGFAQQFENFFDVSVLGAVTTKGCASHAWQGNPAPRMCEISSGIINSVGLQNPGVLGLIEDHGAYLSYLKDKGTQVICQIAGHTPEELCEAIDLFEQNADFQCAYEINISCPNVKSGKALGATAQDAACTMQAVRTHTHRPIFVKMAPVNVIEIAKALEQQGADALTVINSIPAMAIDIYTRKSKLSKPTGGMSGPALHNIALRMVWEVCNAVKIPVCGVGGIMSFEDAAEFILAGASLVSVGSANLVNPTCAKEVVEGLETWAQGMGVSAIRELIGAYTC